MTVKINDTLVTSNDLQGQTANYFDIDLKLLAPSSSDDKIKRLLSCDAEKQYLQYKAQQSTPYDLTTTNNIQVIEQPADNTELYEYNLGSDKCKDFNLTFKVKDEAVSVGTRYILEQPGLLSCKSQDNTLYFRIPEWDNAWKKVDPEVLSSNNTITLEAYNSGTGTNVPYYAFTNGNTTYYTQDNPAVSNPHYVFENISNNNCTNTSTSIFQGSSGAYLKTNSTPALSTAESWEFKTKCTYNGGGAYPCITGCSAGDNRVPIFGHVSSNVLNCYMSSDGSSWNLYSGTVRDIDTSATLTMTAGQTYYFKWGFTGTEYYAWYSTVGWDDRGTTLTFLRTSTKVFCGDPMLLLNNNYNLSNYYWSGTIDLAQTSLTVDGVKTSFGYYAETSTIYNRTNNEFTPLSPQPEFTAHTEGLENASIVGTLTENDGVYSGFETSQKQYIIANNKFNYSADTWTIITKIKFNSLKNCFFVGSGYVGYEGNYSILLGINSSGSLWSLLGSGSGWFSEKITSKTIEAGRYYWIKYYYTGTKYLIDVSTTGEFNGEEENYMDYDNPQKVYNTDNYIMWGTNPYSNNGSWSIDGEIDMKETKYICDNVTTTFYSTYTGLDILDPQTQSYVQYLRNQQGDLQDTVYFADRLKLTVNDAEYTLVDNLDGMPIIKTGVLAIREDLRR